MLSKKRRIISRDLARIAHPVAAGETIYEGAIVVLNAADYAAPGTEAVDLVVVGHAEETVDNSAGVDGEQSVTVSFDRAFRYDNDAVAPVTRADILSDCFILDDHTVSADNTGRSRAGTVVDLDEDGVWISFIKV